MRRRSRSGTIPQADRDDGRRQDHGLGVACALDIGDSVRAIPFRKVIFGTAPAAGFHCFTHKEGRSCRGATQRKSFEGGGV